MIERPVWEQATGTSLQRFLATAGPMVIVQLVAFTLLVVSESTRSIGGVNELEFGPPRTSALIALVVSAIVFPIALQPLVRWVSSFLFRSEDRHRARETDKVLLRKFGFALSAFSDEFDAVLEPGEYQRLSRARRAVEFSRLRIGSYTVAVVPLAVLGAYLADPFGQSAYFSVAIAAVLTLVLASVTGREMGGLSLGYWTLRASMAVHHRFDVLNGLNLRLPVTLTEERERWKDAAALVVGRGDLFDPLDTVTSSSPQLDAEDAADDERKKVERRIRYVFDESAVVAVPALVPPAEIPPPPIGYDGYIWSVWSGSDDSRTLSVTISPSEREDGPAENLSLSGRRDPYVEFRVIPDTDDFDVSPSELVLRPGDSGATAVFRAVLRPDRRHEPALWVQVMQNKSPVATLTVEWDEVGEEERNVVPG